MILDTLEMDRILEKLESMEDEVLAVKFLKEFNDLTARLGKLINNRDPDLDSDTWKKMCDDAMDDVQIFLDKLESVS